MLHGNAPDTAKPEAVLLVLDSTNLARHLMLAAPILALGLPTLIILNMADDLRNRGGKLDLRKLSARTRRPGAAGQRARRAKASTRSSISWRAPWPSPCPRCCRCCTTFPSAANGPAASAPKPRYRAADRAQVDAPAGRGLPASRRRPAALPAGSGRRHPHHLHGGAARSSNAAQNGDSTLSGNWLASALPASPLHSLLVDGVWKGVGSVLVFLPQVLLLFLFIGILEDSGYLARAALIADRTMARVGLQGKSFIPLLSAYGCAVPAILATRTIENKRDRIATILIAPFMTCSARLPVYALLIAAFIPERNLLGSVITGQVAAPARPLPAGLPAPRWSPRAC